MKTAAMVLILLSMTACASFHQGCESSDRKPGSESKCEQADRGQQFAPAIDPSIRF